MGNLILYENDGYWFNTMRKKDYPIPLHLNKTKKQKKLWFVCFNFSDIDIEKDSELILFLKMCYTQNISYFEYKNSDFFYKWFYTDTIDFDYILENREDKENDIYYNCFLSSETINYIELNNPYIFDRIIELKKIN